MACGWGSFNGAKAAELRTWGIGHDRQKGGNTEISCEGSGEERVLSEISVTSRISVRMNRERVSFSELRTHIPALCFLPGDMDLTDGAPAVRRAFIDKLCAMLSVPYAKRLSDYKRLVRHRIKLLRGGKSPVITSRLMSSIGSWIWHVRSSAVKMLDESIFTGGGALPPFPLRVRLVPGGIGNGEGCAYGADAMRDKFMERLEFYSERELRAKAPFVGPHRDDISISVGGYGENEGECSGELSAAVLSRGQKRRAVISLILASGRVMESRLRRKPLFLLDEVFSELDGDARRIVADALYDTGWQIFATSAENMIPNWRGKIYELSGGSVYENPI